MPHGANRGDSDRRQVIRAIFRRLPSFAPAGYSASKDMNCLIARVILRYTAAALFLLVGAALGLAAPPHSLGPRPNIVLILADDLGYSDLGCFGSEIATPHLDRLAAGGVRFSQFYTTPRCCPSRAALMTGLYPHQAGIGHMMEDHGIPAYAGELSSNCLTIAEALQPAGYRPLMVGKWHMSHIRFDGKRQLNFESNLPFWTNQSSWPLQRGFEDYFGTIHGVSSYYEPFSLTEGNTPMPPPATNFYYTDAISDRAVADIEKYGGHSQPFFLYVAYTAPHWPLQAPDSEIAKYESTYLAGWDAIRTQRYQRQLQLGLIDKQFALSPRDPGVRAWEQVEHKTWQARRMATYAAMVEHLDRGVGRIFDELKRRNLEENTLIIFMSDNGACAEPIEPGFYDVPSKTRDGHPIKVGNTNFNVLAGPVDVWQSYGLPWANVSDTPFRLYKHFVHEGGIASPLIAYWPAGIQSPGRLTSQIAHVTDLMPTFLQLAGATYPTNHNGLSVCQLPGQSLAPVFQDSASRDHPPIYWEHEGNRAVRIGKWKLVCRHPGKWELYDMEQDRTELKDLAADQPQRVNELVALYEAWAQRCSVLPWEQVPPAKK